MSALGHSRPGPAGRHSSHVRYASKATFSHQNAIGRDGPMSDIAPPFARLNGDQASTRLIEPRKSILPTSTPLWRRMA
jgi:hypothetical protein